jgi:hypothetical protein
LSGDTRALANGAGGRRVTDYMIDIILQLGAAHLEFLDFLINREIDFLLDTIDFVIEPMILIKDASEVIIGALQAPDDLAMFRELSQDGMMQVHGDRLVFWVAVELTCLIEPGRRGNKLEVAGSRAA